MYEKRYKTGEFAKLIGVHIKTLQRLDREGKLIANRTKTNRRYYTDQQYNEYLINSRVLLLYKNLNI